MDRYGVRYSQVRYTLRYRHHGAGGYQGAVLGLFIQVISKGFRVDGYIKCLGGSRIRSHTTLWKGHSKKNQDREGHRVNWKPIRPYRGTQKYLKKFKSVLLLFT